LYVALARGIPPTRLNLGSTYQSNKGPPDGHASWFFSRLPQRVGIGLS
jgi:hypothetical protein